MVKLCIASMYSVIFKQIYVVLATVLSTLKKYDKGVILHADYVKYICVIWPSKDPIEEEY